jgi:hypothetical protein
MDATAERRKRAPTKRRVEAGRARAAARQRALSRLAREYPERYRELYASERGESR